MVFLISMLVFLAGVVDSLGLFFYFVAVLGGFATIIGFFGYIIGSTDSTISTGAKEFWTTHGKKIILRGFSIMLISGIFSSMMPNKPTMYTIAAIYAGSEVMKQADLNEFYKNSFGYLNDYVKLEREKIQQELVKKLENVKK